MKTDPDCGHPIADWEVRCTQCALAKSIPVDWYILSAIPSRLSEVPQAAKAFGAAFSLILVAWGLEASLPLLVSDTLLNIGRLIALILWGVGLFFIGVFLTGLFTSHQHESWDISKRAIRYSGDVVFRESVEDPRVTDIRFFENEVPLSDVRRVEVRQGWLGRTFNYGDIEVFGEDGSKRKMIISRIIDPMEFRARFVDILQHRNDMRPGVISLRTRSAR
jgi:hypothetical protein